MIVGGSHVSTRAKTERANAFRSDGQNHQSGIGGATMEHIMRVSGLSKGLAYHYFPSKEKIFLHLIDTALEISKKTWEDAYASPGTAWEKIEKLSENVVKIAFTDESSLYSLIMIQAVTQGKGIPGFLEHIFQRLTFYNGLLPLIIEAQKSGEAAPGDPGLLMLTYVSLVQGLVLFLLGDNEMRKIITPEVLTKVLRNTGKTE
jgi:AcrR family transcriptional regulator